MSIFNDSFSILTFFSLIFCLIIVGAAAAVFVNFRSRTERFLNQPSQQNYAAAKDLYVISIVCIVLLSIYLLNNALGVIFDFFRLLVGADETVGRSDLFISMGKCAAFVTLIVIGAKSVFSFSEAKALYFRLYPPLIPKGQPADSSEKIYTTAAIYDEKICPSCGKANDGRSNSCVSCGTELK